MLYRQQFRSRLIFLILIGLLLQACNQSGSPGPEKLYSTHCGSCHMTPEINSLPRQIWENNILPNMAARMGIAEGDYNPLRGLSFDEMEATMRTGIYNVKPVLNQEDWALLKDYILSTAPDSLKPIPPVDYYPMDGFITKPLNLDTIAGSKNITYLNYNSEDNYLVYGDLRGGVYKYNWDAGHPQFLAAFSNPIISYSHPEGKYATAIGQLNPTQMATGQIFEKANDRYNPFGGYLHRPVHTLIDDLNGDGKEEIVISEFGDLVGKLSLFSKDEKGSFEKRILLPQPGSIRAISRDMNNDDRTDLIVLTAQGEEGITILYQEEDLQFRPERVLRFSPVYGTSWFELIDYDGDGDQDLITANGDNADKSYVHKPYHGFRLFLNDGKNNFKQVYFYPMHGATRVMGRDFDQDGDIDFCLLATFPDYDKEPLLPFVYLQNDDPDTYSFSSEVLENPDEGRWLLMDSGDIDKDGDEDIILSPFTYIFTPVPDQLNKKWNENGSDLLILENRLFEDE